MDLSLTFVITEPAIDSCPAAGTVPPSEDDSSNNSKLTEKPVEIGSGDKNTTEVISVDSMGRGAGDVTTLRMSFIYILDCCKLVIVLTTLYCYT